MVNQLSNERRRQVISCLVEGNSIRATCRMTGVAKNTVLKLLAEIGPACEKLHNRAAVGLTCQRVQCDEIWAFCYAKEKNLPPELKGKFGFGDVWTYVAICETSKLVIQWHVGNRDYLNASKFMCSAAERLTRRVNLTTDGHKMYLQAVDDAFGGQVDYAILQKLYGSEPEAEKRYSPAKCIGVRKETGAGSPDLERASTSYVERQNLTIRMSNRRFTRLTNAFSKKVENLKHSLALHFTHYNFCRVHQTLRVTPAMEAGLTDHVWEIDELVKLLLN